MENLYIISFKRQKTSTQQENKDNATVMSKSLQVLRTGRLYPQAKIPGSHFC